MADLTTLAKVKDFLGLEPGDLASDTALARLITAKSKAFLQAIGRDILKTTYVETIDGSSDRIRSRPSTGMWAGFNPGTISVGERGWALNLLNGPVISIASVLIDGSDGIGALASVAAVATVARSSNVVTVTTGAAHGIAVGQGIALSGVTDTSFNASATVASVPSSTTFTFAQTGSNASSSGGTVVPAVPQAQNIGQPTQVDGWAVVEDRRLQLVGSTYGFPRGVQNIKITYDAGYVTAPEDVEQAVIDWVDWAFEARDRTGQRSKVVGGDNVTFMVDDVPPAVQAVINLWRRRQV